MNKRNFTLKENTHQKLSPERNEAKNLWDMENDHPQHESFGREAL